MSNLYEYQISNLVIRKYIAQYNSRGISGYPITTNGSFYFYDKKQQQIFPAGPTSAKDTGNFQGVPRGYVRGAVGLFGGQAKVRLLKNDLTKPLADDIKEAFGGIVPSEYMGGGLMLIDNGRIFTIDEIKKQQMYDALGGRQLEKNNHVLIGNKGNSTYLLIALQLSSDQIVKVVAGYTHLCMLDGGKAFWVRTPDVSATGTNYGSPEPPYFALGAAGTLVSKKTI